MTDSGARRALVAFWLIAIAIIGWREIKANPGAMPRPYPFVGSIMVYGALLIGAEFVAPLATAIGAGWTLGLLYKSVAIVDKAVPAADGAPAAPRATDRKPRATGRKATNTREKRAA